MEYEVQIVDDGSLAGRDMVIVERGPGRPAAMLLCGRPARVWAAMRSWEDSRDCGTPTLLYAAS